MPMYEVEWTNLGMTTFHWMRKKFTSANSARKEVMRRGIRSAIVFVLTSNDYKECGQIMLYKGTYLWHPTGKPKCSKVRERIVKKDGSLGEYYTYKH